VFDELNAMVSSTGDIDAEYIIPGHGSPQTFTLTATQESSGLTAQTVFTNEIDPAPFTWDTSSWTLPTTLPYVVTDKGDYAPGEMVQIFGAGWTPGEIVVLEIAEDGPQNLHPAEQLHAVAREGGVISGTISAGYVIQHHDLGQQFTLTATGLTSGLTAQTTFTDNINVTVNNPTFAWHRTGEVPGGFDVSGVAGTYTCNTIGAANNRCTAVTNLTITVSGAAGSKVLPPLVVPATSAFWGPVTLEFRAIPGAGQFAIPASDGKYNVTATLNTNATNSPSTDTENNYFGVDNTKPVTDLQCDTNNPCNNNPYNANATVNVKLKADDGNAAVSSGIASTIYCIDTTNTCTPITPYPGGSGFDVTYVDGATYYVRYFSTDNVGNVETTKSQAIVFAAANTAPTVAFTTAPATANEGDTKTYNFSITDPDASQTFTFVAGFPDCGTGGTLGSSSINSGAKTGTFDCSFPDGPANPTVRVQVRDSFSTPASSNIATVAVVVSNVAPTVTLSGSTSAGEGETKSYSYTTSDPGQDTFSLVSQSCGTNGTLSNDSFDSATGAGSFDCTFPDGPDSSDVSVQVADSDGDNSNTDTKTVTIANVAPTVSLTGDASADEGQTKSYSYTTSDPGQDTFSLVSQSCGTNGTLSNDSFDSAAGAGSFDCTFPDGPDSSDVSVQVADSDGDNSNTDTKTVTIANVAPTVTASFSPIIGSCNPLTPPELTVNFTDPGDDTHTVTIDWGDGSAVDDLGTVTSPFSASHTYVLAGMYHAKVTVTDSDGAPTDNDNDFTVNFTIVGGGVLPPINQDGTSVFKFKSTIPTKIKVQNCDGSYPSNLAPTIALTMKSGATPGLEINEPISTSAADTTGIMRVADQQYIYNLATKPLPDSSATYKIKITIPATLQEVTATFGLKP
jgi:hypothetical protein